MTSETTWEIRFQIQPEKCSEPLEMTTGSDVTNESGFVLLSVHELDRGRPCILCLSFSGEESCCGMYFSLSGSFNSSHGVIVCWRNAKTNQHSTHRQGQHVVYIYPITFSVWYGWIRVLWLASQRNHDERISAVSLQRTYLQVQAQRVAQHFHFKFEIQLRREQMGRVRWNARAQSQWALVGLAPPKGAIHTSLSAQAKTRNLLICSFHCAPCAPSTTEVPGLCTDYMKCAQVNWGAFYSTMKDFLLVAFWMRRILNQNACSVMLKI